MKTEESETQLREETPVILRILIQRVEILHEQGPEEGEPRSSIYTELFVLFVRLNGTSRDLKTLKNTLRYQLNFLLVVLK